MNYVCIIGVLVEKNSSYLVINTGKELIKVFYKDMNINILNLNTTIKIEGKITNIGFPFDVVLAENIYNIKDKIH